MGQENNVDKYSQQLLEQLQAYSPVKKENNKIQFQTYDLYSLKAKAEAAEQKFYECFGVPGNNNSQQFGNLIKQMKQSYMELQQYFQTLDNEKKSILDIAEKRLSAMQKENVDPSDLKGTQDLMERMKKQKEEEERKNGIAYQAESEKLNSQLTENFYRLAESEKFAENIINAAQEQLQTTKNNDMYLDRKDFFRAMSKVLGETEDNIINAQAPNSFMSKLLGPLITQIYSGGNGSKKNVVKFNQIKRGNGIAYTIQVTKFNELDSNIQKKYKEDMQKFRINGKKSTKLKNFFTEDFGDFNDQLFKKLEGDKKSKKQTISDIDNETTQKTIISLLYQISKQLEAEDNIKGRIFHHYLSLVDLGKDLGGKRSIAILGGIANFRGGIGEVLGNTLMAYFIYKSFYTKVTNQEDLLNHIYNMVVPTGTATNKNNSSDMWKSIIDNKEDSKKSIFSAGGQIPVDIQLTLEKDIINGTTTNILKETLNKFGFQIKQYTLKGGKVFEAQGDPQSAPSFIASRLQVGGSLQSIILALFGRMQFNNEINAEAVNTINTVLQPYSLRSIGDDKQLFLKEGIDISPDLVNTFFIINGRLLPGSIMIDALISSIIQQKAVMSIKASIVKFEKEQDDKDYRDYLNENANMYSGDNYYIRRSEGVNIEYTTRINVFQIFNDAISSVIGEDGYSWDDFQL